MRSQRNLTKARLAAVAITALVVPGVARAQTEAGTLRVEHVAHDKPDYSPFVDRLGLDLPDEIPMTTQERAYTSPIWYTP